MIQSTGVTYVGRVNHLLARVLDPNTGQPPTNESTASITVTITNKTTDSPIVASTPTTLHDVHQFDPDRWHESDGYNIETQYTATTTGSHEVRVELQPVTGEAYPITWTLQVFEDQQ